MNQSEASTRLGGRVPRGRKEARMERVLRRAIIERARERPLPLKAACSHLSLHDHPELPRSKKSLVDLGKLARCHRR